MEEKRFAVEATISTEEMKRIRKKLDLTQKGFVGLLGCSKKTVERWEKEPDSDKKLYGQCNVPGVWKKGTSGYG